MQRKLYATPYRKKTVQSPMQRLILSIVLALSGTMLAITGTTLLSVLIKRLQPQQALTLSMPSTALRNTVRIAQDNEPEELLFIIPRKKDSPTQPSIEPKKIVPQTSAVETPLPATQQLEEIPTEDNSIMDEGSPQIPEEYTKTPETIMENPEAWVISGITLADITPLSGSPWKKGDLATLDIQCSFTLNTDGLLSNFKIQNAELFSQTLFEKIQKSFIPVQFKSVSKPIRITAYILLYTTVQQ